MDNEKIKNYIRDYEIKQEIAFQKNSKKVKMKHLEHLVSRRQRLKGLVESYESGNIIGEFDVDKTLNDIKKIEEEVSKLNFSEESEQTRIKNQLELSSKEWRTIPMAIIRQLKNDGPGVYMIYRDKKPHYIGEAKSIKTRLKSHLSDIRRWSSIEMYCVRAILTDKRLELEKALILKYQPKGNIQHNNDLD